LQLKTSKYVKLMKSIILSTTFGFLLYVPYLVAINYDLSKYMLSVAIFVPIFFFYLLFLFSSMGGTLTYFYLTCCMVKMRIRRHLTSYQLEGKKLVKSRVEVLTILTENVQLLGTIYTLNQFWSIYVLFAHLFYILIVSFMSYLAFVAPVGDPMIRLVYYVVEIEFTSLIVFTCLSAAQINCLVHECHTKLFQLVKTTNGKSLNHKLFNRMSCFQLKQVGFSCYDFFIVSYHSFFKVSANWIYRFLDNDLLYSL